MGKREEMEERSRRLSPEWAASEEVRLDSGLTEKLRALGRGEGATLEEVVAAAWVGLLARALRCRKSAVEITAAGREDSQAALRLEVADDPPFSELLRLTKRGWTGAVEFSTAELSLGVQETDAGVALRLEYANGMYQEEVAREILDAMACALRSVAAAPDSPLSRLRLLSEERERAEFCWQGARRAVGGPLVERIVEGSQQRAGQVAFVCGARSATYGDYLETARGTAALLRRAGVAAGGRVAVMARRSERLPAYLLGVWMAGCATVPVDPSWPAERVSFVVEDSGANLMLAEREAGNPAPACGVEWLDDLAAAGECCECSPLTPASAACVIYTSGSTGRPKGAEILHGAMTNVLDWLARVIPVGPDDVVVNVASFAFDACFADFYLAPAVGAAVFIAEEQEARGGALLGELLDNSGATYMNVTPTAFQSLIESGWRGSKRLKALSGGEALSPQLAAALLPKVGALWNVYGPTETTDISAAARIDSAEPLIPLGVPADNTDLYILDEWRRPVLPGMPGELAIGGAGLASGYVNRPALTAERFVTLETPDGPRRVYLTGDLVRRRAADKLEYLGRIDHQVKVRGHRVELGEVEAELARLKGVNSAAVVLQKDSATGPRLAAFFTGEGVGAELRDALRARLPEYMIPGLIQRLEQWPRTSSGKIDRQALERMAPLALPPEEAPEAATELERRVLALFGEVLGRADLTPADDFFDAGGHSLLAVRFINLLRVREGRAMGLRQFFARSTVRAVAAWLDGQGGGAGAQ